MKSFKNLAAVLSYIHKHPLAGRHKIKAFSKFFGWQISQLINPAERVIPFVENTCLSVSKGMTGATGNIYLGIHDYSEMSFLLHFLTPDDLFADVGANIGSYSILASGVNGAKTIAFEPSINTFSQLQKNISLNGLQNKVISYNLALGSKVGKLVFTTSLDTVNHVVPSYEMEEYKGGVEVNVDTLDNVLEMQGCPILIKIDVEGFETEVINGMQKTLEDSNLKAIIIELNGSGMRYGYDEVQIHNKLVHYGFLPYAYDPIYRAFSLMKNYGASNTLYLRDFSLVEGRVVKARKIKVFNESI